VERAVVDIDPTDEITNLVRRPCRENRTERDDQLACVDANETKVAVIDSSHRDSNRADQIGIGEYNLTGRGGEAEVLYDRIAGSRADHDEGSWIRFGGAVMDHLDREDPVYGTAARAAGRIGGDCGSGRGCQKQECGTRNAGLSEHRVSSEGSNRPLGP